MDQWDYVTFALLVTFSMGIGVYSRFSGTQFNRSKAGFSFATGNVSSFAVLLSIARTGIGIRVFLGIPAELYYHGAGMWEGLYGVELSLIVVSVVFMPVYFAMPTTSIYEYLELRFKSGLVRRLASMLYVVRSILMLGVTTFTPCVAIRAVVGVPYWISILGVGVLSMIFTAIGGMRGVILNDVLQVIALFGCTIAIVVSASLKLPNGIIGAFQLAAEKGRLNFFNFDPDPTIRVTTISALLGQVFSSTTTYGCQQAFAQKYRSLPNAKIVTRTLICASPLVAFMESLLWVGGVVLFALYAHCDPLTARFTSKIDDIVPYFVQQEFSAVPGLVGLFVASLFNGSLGVAVSILNSVATVTWEDFLSKNKFVSHLSDGQQVRIIRLIGIFYGFAIMGMAMLASTITGLIEASQLVSAITNGPLLGVFFLALLFPQANKKGAICGLMTSLALTLIMTIGRTTVTRGVVKMLPLSVDQCPVDVNLTDVVSMTDFQYRNVTEVSINSDRSWIVYFFSITYMYYSILGCTICITIGLIVSYFTASVDELYEDTLIHPWAKKISNALPGKKRVFIPSSPLFKTKLTDSISTIEFITHL